MRATALLGKDYSFYEAQDIYTAQEAFHTAQTKAQHATQMLKTSLREDVSSYRAQLNLLIDPYPLLQKAVEHDIKTVTDYAHQFSQQFLTQLHKYIQYTSSMKESHDEYTTSDPFELYDVYEDEKRQTALETLKSNLQTIRLVGNIQTLGKTDTTLSNVFIGLMGFIFVQLIIDQITARVFVGAAIVAFFLTPILEEVVKVFSVKYLKSQTSLSITYALEALYESFLLIAISLGIAGKGHALGMPWSVLGPLAGALFFTASLFGEKYIFQRQHLTTQMYTDDVARLGKVRPQTFLKGVVLHFTWDIMGFLSGLQRTFKYILNTLLDLGLVVRKAPGLSTAFTRVFGARS